MNSTWYGGYSFEGRYWWPAFSLWVFPTAYSVGLFLKRSRAVVLLLCASGVFLQVLLASRWLLQDQSLYLRDFGKPIWASTNLYADLLDPELWLRLPFFKEFDNYLSHPPNYVFVLLRLLLVTTGWWWQRGKTHLIGVAWALFSAMGISILVFIPLALNPLAFTADELPSQTGAKDGEGRVATEPESKEGYLISASFTALPARRYEVDLEYESSGEPGEPTARWEIVTDAGTTVVADGVLPPSTANMDRFNHKLVVSELPSLGKMVMEFRVLYPSQGSLRVERLTITPLSVAED